MTDNGSIFFVSFSLSFLNSVTRHCIIVFFFSALHGVNDRREVILQGAFIYTQHVRSAARLHSFFFLLRFFFRSRGSRECDNGRHNKGTTIRDDATRVLSWTPSVSSARRYPNRARYKGFAAGVTTLQQHVLVPADVTK